MSYLTFQPGLLPRTVGHGCGVIGVMFGLDAVATMINPHFVSLFPFQAGGIERDAAAVISLAMIAVAGWLVWASEYRRRKTLAALTRKRVSQRNDDER
jgi:hypothetical protein